MEQEHPEQRYIDLAGKWLNGTITPEEEKEFAAWYAQQHDVTVPPSFAEHEEQLKERILAAIREKGGMTARREPLHRPDTRMVAAAAVVVMLAAGLQLWYTRDTGRPIAETIAPATQPTVPYSRYITLPSGSRVVLHAGSRLQYPGSFSGNTREVSLAGEAYFDVQPGSQPFIIHTGRIKTTVLGTAFNIKAYTKSRDIIVSVSQGKVRVEDERQVLAELSADQQLVYNKQATGVTKEAVNTAAVTGWTKQDMIFDAMPFGDIADVLSKRYGVNIGFGNEALRHCPVKASFDGTETLNDVLTALCTILNASFTQQDNGTIIITGKGCE